MADVGERRTINGQLAEWDGKGWKAVAQDASVPRTPSDSSAIAMSTQPLIRRAVEEAATNPNIPQIGSRIGRVLAPTASIATSAYEGGPLAAAAATGLAGKTAWAGGKAGWFTGKLAQGAAAPVANALNAAAPVLSRMTGAQGLGDLAQMADPKRTDIGFMGIGGHPDSVNGVPWDQYIQQHPPLLNAIVQKLMALGAAKP